MTIEELVEVREILECELLPPEDEDRKACLHCDAIEVAIGLINSEIERQSVTDEDVQQAIAVFEKADFERNFWPGVKNINLALDALRQYRKPEPEPESEYDGLKAKYEVRKKRNGALVDDCFVLRPDKDHASVMALRTYAEHTENKKLANDICEWIGKSEPCEWCNDQFYYAVLPHEDLGEYYFNALEHSYCPNCGRKLVED